MKRYLLRTAIFLFIVFSIAGVFYAPGCLSAAAQDVPGVKPGETEKNNGDKAAEKSAGELKKIEAAKERPGKPKPKRRSPKKRSRSRKRL